MRRTLVLALMAVSCGDDGSAATNADDSSTGAADSTTGGDDSGSTTGSLDTSSTGSTGADGSTTGDDSSSSAAETSQGSSSSSDGSTTGGQGDGCLPPEIFAAIDQHAHDLAATAGLLAGHPSQAEVSGFLLAPGLPTPPALAASFAGPLVMTCSGPLLYDEFCEEGRCQQIECTGEGSSWINHVWVEPAIADDAWSFDEVHLHMHWSGGAGIVFDIATTSTGPGGADMSLTGTGEMDIASMSVVETFPALHSAGDTVLEYSDDAGGYSGQLTIADVVVATVDDADAGHLEPTGDCP